MSNIHVSKCIKDIMDTLKLGDNQTVDLDIIIKNYGIRIKKANIGTKIAGAYKVDGLKKYILINKNIQDDNRVRFTTAHELGHIFLRHPPTMCSYDIHRWIKNLPDYEKEANQFAIELLLPMKAMVKNLNRCDLSVPIIKQIANKYGVSLTATGIRLTKITKDSAVLLLHTRDRILWYIKSEQAPYRMNESGIVQNKIIDTLNSEQRYLKKTVSPEIWLDGNCDSIECVQESLYLNKRDEYFTLISFV